MLHICCIGSQVLGALSSKCHVVPVPVLELYKLVIFMVGELKSHEDPQCKPLLLGRDTFQMQSRTVDICTVSEVSKVRGSSRGVFGAGTKVEDLSSSLENLTYPFLRRREL